MTLYEEVLTKADQLSIAEKAQLLEHLSAALKNDLEIEGFRRMPWQEFVKRTAGMLADDPVERPSQPPLEERDLPE